MIDRASALVFAAMQVCTAVRNGTLPADKLLGRVPCDAAQYLRFFGSARIPGLGKDSLSVGD